MTESNFQDQFRRIMESAGLSGQWKKIRKGSATNVEIRYPGAGAAHLGHAAGSIARTHYIDPKLVAFHRPLPVELSPPAVVQKDLRLADFLAIHAKAHDFGPSMIRSYSQAVMHLERWAGHPVRCGEAAGKMLSDFLRDINEEGRLSSRTLLFRRHHLTDLCHAAHAQLQTERPAEAPGGIS